MVEKRVSEENEGMLDDKPIPVPNFNTGERSLLILKHTFPKFLGYSISKSQVHGPRDYHIK